MLFTRSNFRKALTQLVLSIFVLFMLAVLAHGAAGTNKVAAKLKFIPACSNLVSAAELNRVPLDGMDAAASTNALRPGDAVTVLVTFVQKTRQTQWLLHLEAGAPDPASRTNKPSTFVVNSSFGPPEKFESRPVPVRLRLFGPYAAGPGKQPKAEESIASFALNEGFLGLGMDQAAALLSRWSQTTNFDGAVTSKALQAMNPSPAEQRAVCAVFPALVSYFDIVQHTDGLESLLRKLIETPSLWSLIRHRGVNVSLTFGNGASPSPAEPNDWNLPPAAAVYHFPWLVRLNDKPALRITLVVTRPQTPLLICGGVTGLLAEKIGDDETYMTMRVISALSQKLQTD
jgi:hypothetical protein